MPARHLVHAEHALPGEARVLAAAERSLSGERRGFRALLPFLGPAFIAAVAYVDPGNFATNIAAGSKFGYTLLWVVLAANLMAMLVQSLSAKLGIATGQNLAEVCRDRFPRPVVIFLWLQAEAIAMATDLAEFVGAAIGLAILFDMPLFVAGLVTAVVAFGVLALQERGFRRGEALIAGLVGAIVFSFAIEVFLAPVSGHDVLGGTFVPHLPGNEATLLAVGIIGATVMPHVIYLHSALTQRRLVGVDDAARRKIFRFELIDVVIAMSIAGFINMAMLTTSAAVFHTRGLTEVGRRPDTRRDPTRDVPACGRGHGVRDRAPRVRDLFVVGRDAGGSGRDAGVHPAPDPALRPAGRDDGAQRCSCLRSARALRTRSS